MKNSFLFLFLFLFLLSVPAMSQSKLERTTPREENDPLNQVKLDSINSRLSLSDAEMDSLRIKEYLINELVHELYLTSESPVKISGIKHNLTLFISDSRLPKEVLIYMLQFERERPNSPMGPLEYDTKKGGERIDLDVGYSAVKYLYEINKFDFVANGTEVTTNLENPEEKSYLFLKDVLNYDISSKKETNPFQSVEFIEFKKAFKSYYSYRVGHARKLLEDQLSGKPTKEYGPLTNIEKFHIKVNNLEKVLRLRGRIFREKYPYAIDSLGVDKIMEEIKKKL